MKERKMQVKKTRELIIHAPTPARELFRIIELHQIHTHVFSYSSTTKGQFRKVSSWWRLTSLLKTEVTQHILPNEGDIFVTPKGATLRNKLKQFHHGCVNGTRDNVVTFRGMVDKTLIICSKMTVQSNGKALCAR